MSHPSARSVSMNLVSRFAHWANTQPEHLALVVDENQISYGELARRARRVAGLVEETGRGSGFVMILASRTEVAYSAILGTLWAGSAYIPIHPNTPKDRLEYLLELTRPDILVVDRQSLPIFEGAGYAGLPPVVLFDDSCPIPEVDGGRPEGWLHFSELTAEGTKAPVPMADTDLAYIMFTSGTTGRPKGVMLELGSVWAFVDVTQERFRYTPEDRVSQVAEISFDMTVSDLFVSWSAGTSVHVVPAKQVLAPARFISDQQLTTWFSVPSIAAVMHRLGMVKPGAFPLLKRSFFSGETMPAELALAWKAAAPNAHVENLYGPTEVTCVCTGHPVTIPPDVTPERNSISIGCAYPGVEARIVNAEMREVARNQPGELIVAGRQVARGYFHLPEVTAKAFPLLEGEVWYRTGDLAYMDEQNRIHHLGRIDNQVKILGNRVELEEVESHLRAALGTEQVAALAWPLDGHRPTGIVGFYSGAEVSKDEMRRKMLERVPHYMIPTRLVRMETMPFGSTGKISRSALKALLEEQKNEVR